MARILAVVAVAVALVGTLVGVAVHAEAQRTDRLDAYARFDEAERNLQQVADTYDDVGVRSAAPVDFQRIESLYRRAEASYAALGEALNGIRAVGPSEMTDVAERLCSTERERLDALYVDPAGGVIPGYPTIGPPREHPRQRYERVKKDADQLYDRFTRLLEEERSTR